MRHSLFLGLAAAALIAPVAVHAQETTSIIRGSVTQAGAPVAGATVSAVNVPSGTRSTVRTDADGSFSFPGLRPGGPYTVTVASPQGNTTVTDIFTVVQQPFDLPIDLVAEEFSGNEIVVTASSIRNAGVDSDGPQTVLTQQDIAKVASVNRDIRDIERRDPFAAIDFSNAGSRGGAVSFAGVNPRFNRFTINGAQIGDQFGLNQDASPTNRGPVPYDALAQVSVSIAPYDFRQTNFQGGVIDAVLLSGTNQLHANGFYSINTDGLSGDTIGSTTIVNPDYTSETYGLTLSGPIIPNKLFFMVSGERNTDPRPFSTLVGQIPNFNVASVDQLRGIAGSTYGITGDAFGDILTINNRKDEKIAGRIDWNITDNQRFSLSYINAYDSLVSQNNTSTSAGTPRYGLSSNAYALTELLRAGIAQLNSDWTDNFSTEARFVYKSYVRGQEPLGGRTISQFSVCLDPTSVGALGASAATGCSTGIPTVTFGPDNFRQTNDLYTDTYAGSFLTRLRLNGHELKLLADFNRNRTFNNFVPNSLASYYFDSVADFQAGQANNVQYGAVIGTDPNGAAADFRYDQWGFGVQDDWQVMGNLTVSYGARWDLYAMNDFPVSNPFFQQRNGFSNQKTLKGLNVFQPRASFNWNPTPILTIRGGGGIFAGGAPDIFLSNSFSNTVTTNTLNITRATGGVGCTGAAGLTTALCAAALNGVQGNVNPALNTFASNPANVASLRLTNTGALDPNFQIPSSWKATLSADLAVLGFDVGADYYFSSTRDGIIFTDGRSVQVGTLPDGRPRYTAVTTPTDNNYDIITSNSKDGRSHIGVVRIQKRFDFGLSGGGSYTLQDVRDVGPATSSTINSNYRYQAFADPNFPLLGTSDNQIKWTFKYNLGFDHAFFRDYRTTIQLFGETRAGRPYSYGMLENTNNRTTVFGTPLTGANATNLLYVPTGINDPLVRYGDAATAAALDALINRTELSEYRGQIAPKNISRNRAFTRIDLHLEQEIPTFVGRSRIVVFGDINNLPNLIDSDWGGLRQLGFPPFAGVVSVRCLNAAGTPLTGAIGSATNPATACASYEYSAYRDPNDAAVQLDGSLYAIRLGVRFQF